LAVSEQIMVLSIVVVGFVQAFAISKRFAYKHGYELESSQELIGLGMANFIGAMFQSFPVTGCLGQSAVNDIMGAESGVASFVTGAAVMLVLLFLTPVFEKMPLAALGAIVISYVVSMLVSAAFIRSFVVCFVVFLSSFS
jgi:MFS superfamily sulfate permease-like transporter